MATKINIAQLDIDIDGLKSSMVEAKTELDRLVASNKEMRKSGETVNKTYIEQDAAIKRLRAEYNSQARVLNQAIVAIEGADKAYNAQIKTVAQAEAANKTLRQAVKHLDTTTLEGIATAEKYNARIEENTSFMKDNVDEQIQGYMSVGEYSKGIQDAAKELSPFNILLKGMNGGFKEAGGILPFVTQSLKGVVGGIRAATAASLAFIATPIGAVIAAIGLALGLVINYLKNTESGMDKVMSVLRPLNEVLKAFLEVIENAGKALVEAFTNPVDSIKTVGNLIGKVLVGYVKTAMRYFTNLGKIMLGAVTFDKKMIQEGWDDMKALAEETKDAVVDGFNKAKNKVDEFGNSLKDASENGRRIHDLTIAIRKSTEDLAASENDYKDALLEQEKIYKDRSQSEDARLKAAQAMRDLQEDRSKQIQHQLTLEIERHEREIDAGEDNHEQRMKLIELEKKLGDEKRKVGDYDVAQLSRINNIRERGERDSQKALDRQKKAEEEYQKLIESRNALLSINTAILEEEAKIISDTTDETIKSYNEQIDILDLLTESEVKKNKASIEGLQADIEARELLIKQGKDTEDSNKELLDLKSKQLEYQKNINIAEENAVAKKKEIREAELEDQRALDAAKLKMSKELGILLADGDQERTKAIRELREQELLEDLDTEKAILLEKMELLDLSEEEKTELLLQHEDLRNQLLNELRGEWREEDKQNIADYEAYKRSMARETTDLILDQINVESKAGKWLTFLKKSLALEEWVIQKKKAIAENALAKQTAQTDVIAGQAKTASAAPFPLNVPLILGFLAQTVPLMAMFKKPKVKDPKFARGTVLGGSRHFEGGIKTPFGEVEGGEMLLTRGVTFNPLLRSMASQLNMMGGGDNLDTGSSVGSVSQPKGFIDYDKLANKVAQANSHLPSPTVRVSDIDRVNKSVKVTENLTSL